MTTAQDRLQDGYYNNALRSTANPGGLAGQGSPRLNFPLLLEDIGEVGAAVAQALTDAAASAASALNAPGTAATITAVIAAPAIGDNVVVILDQLNKAYVKGQTLVVSADASPLDQFAGVLTAFVPGTGHGTVHVQFVSAGAWSHNLFNVGLSAPLDATLTGRVSALEAADVAQREEDIFYGRKVY